MTKFSYFIRNKKKFYEKDPKGSLFEAQTLQRDAMAQRLSSVISLLGTGRRKGLHGATVIKVFEV
jgi:hypothetical protein